MPECRIMSRVSNPQRGLRRCGSSCRFPKPGIDGVDGSPAVPKLLTRLREQVARALVSKGARLGALGRNKEAIDVDDDLLARLGTAAALQGIGPAAVPALAEALKDQDTNVRSRAARPPASRSA
jgi:hypothetical protein